MTANALKRRTVSRISYYALCALNYISILLLGDVFLVDILQYTGLGDGAIGIINSASSFVSFVQILLLFIGHKIRRRKVVILFGYTGMAVMFVLVYVIVLLPVDMSLKQVLIVACFLFGKIIVTFASPLLDIYKYSFVSYQERGAFTATNSTVSLATAIVFTLAIGEVRDYFRESGNIEQGLVVTAVFLGAVTLLTALSVMLMRGSSAEASDTKAVSGIKEILQNTLGTKSFLCMLLFYILWGMANNITTNFLSVYKLNELQFSIGTVQIINTVSNIIAMLLARPLGKLADKHTHSLFLKFALMAYVVTFVISALTAPETAWLAFVHAIVSGIAGILLTACFYNMLLECIGPTYYMYGIALITCITCVCGFGVSFLAAWLLETIQSMGNTLFGMTVYAQQILSAISAVMTLGLLGYAHFILTKLPKHQLVDTNKD